MNRRQRRTVEAAAKKRLRAQMQCIVRGHVLTDAWIMRPAWVGAGIVIPKVHFDRTCQRCGALDTVWADIEGATVGQPETMVLPAWLLANSATVTPPPGVVKNPPVDELSAIAAKAEPEAVPVAVAVDGPDAKSGDG